MFPDPIAFWIGNWPVRWYGLSYGAGIMLAWWYCRYLGQRFFHIKREAIDAFVTWAVIGIVLGGRIGYILFYDPQYYWARPEKILHVWEGGMSFHGGLLGTFVAAFLFCWRAKIPLFSLTDCLACGAPIGLFFGRLANFVNQELYGRVTDVPWGLVFPGVDQKTRHPSQLYEAFGEGIILFFLLMGMCFSSRLPRKSGALSGMFLILYGVIRWLCEYTREPTEVSALFPILTLGQLYSVPLFIIGSGLVARALAHEQEISS